VDQAQIIQMAIRPTRAEVDLLALQHNLDTLRAHLGRGGAKIYAVVKADAYGHGAVPVAAALERAGAEGFCVSLVEEGIELRRATRAPVLVLGGYYGSAHRDVVEHGLVPVVFELADVEKLSRAAGERRIAVHVKIDTGMARLGVPTRAAAEFLGKIRDFPNVHVAGLCTHLACADAPDAEVTQAQLERFEVVLRAAGRPGLVHAANSAGAVRFAGSRYDLVRPGIALLGDAASPLAALPGARPVLRLVTRVIAVRDVEPGQTVSYGGLWRAERRSRIATMPLGYADGYPRRLTNAGHVLVRGQRAPVVGAVCMDMFMVDVTGIAGTQLGDEVVLLGEQQGARISASDWASWAGTINYEIYCGISKRVPRVYIG
jgi:alanine racemase